MMLRIENIKESFPCVGPVMTIDTGLHTGWACWNNVETQTISLNWGDFTVPSRIKIFENKLEWLINGWESLLNTHLPRYIYLEGQGLWAQSADSYASTSSGDLFRLSYITGAFAGIAIKKRMSTKIIKPQEWKGQLTKEATMLRMIRALKMLSGFDPKTDEHSTDAIAMGLSLMGKL